jgi:hypothetical protein
MFCVAGHAGLLCGASIRSRRCEVEVKLQLAAMLVRFSRESETPGMFIEPMKRPVKIRLGTIPRDSVCKPSKNPYARGLTELVEGLVGDSTHLQSAHASLIVDEQDELVALLELDV